VVARTILALLLASLAQASGMSYGPPAPAGSQIALPLYGGGNPFPVILADQKVVVIRMDLYKLFPAGLKLQVAGANSRKGVQARFILRCATDGTVTASTYSDRVNGTSTTVYESPVMKPPVGERDYVLEADLVVGELDDSFALQTAILRAPQ
jgi:hypothetical protein